MSAAAIVQRSDRFHDAVPVVVVNRSMTAGRSKEVAITAAATGDRGVAAKIATVLEVRRSRDP